jgi:N6-L-threonylcarbamoyladenine synthase
MMSLRALGRTPMKPFLVLGIETSCDDTAAAVVSDGRNILSNVIASQTELHGAYGGVVPELASRRHVELITPVVAKALLDADVALEDLDAVAATQGPGLAGALLVGVSFAKALAFACGKPCVGIHHIEGHIAANYLAHRELEAPFLCLVVSGGHSHLVAVETPTRHQVLGRTRDDAAGEAFDKVARVLGLGYPGGPEVDRAAVSGNASAFRFPRVQFADSPYDFSFSGLKTAVINVVNQIRQKGDMLPVADLCASFQQAVVDVLVAKAVRAARECGFHTLCLAGGVASNGSLRRNLEMEAQKRGIRFFMPPPILCTDNAAMIACMGTIRAKAGCHAGLEMNAEPALAMNSQ